MFKEQEEGQHGWGTGRGRARKKHVDPELAPGRNVELMGPIPSFIAGKSKKAHTANLTYSG